MDRYYVDKTAHVLRLTRERKYHFLSRPRRFGKGLLVDTLKELFEGNGELFRGLAIHGELPQDVQLLVELDPFPFRAPVSEAVSAAASSSKRARSFSFCLPTLVRGSPFLPLRQRSTPVRLH